MPFAVCLHQTIMLLQSVLVSFFAALACATDNVNITYSGIRRSEYPPYATSLVTEIYDPVTKTTATRTIDGTADKPMSGSWVSRPFLPFM